MPMRLAGLLFAALAVAATSGTAFAAGWVQLPGGYAVKPSEVAIPDGEELGQYRRVVQPFKNWTLICDESLRSKRRVCNLTQSIVDQRGAPVFNWSFVATADGKPLVVMRAPAALGIGQQIGLALGDKPDRIVAQTDRCDGAFCTATIAIGPMLRRHIRAGTDCAVSYMLPSAGEVSFQAPLEGLFTALSAMK
jgi:invasion protein IalB